MHNLLKRLALVGVVAFCAMAFSALAAPKSSKAVYGGSMNGMAIGVITERLDVDANAYRITSESRAIGLAALAQRQPLRFVSRGLLTPEGLRPAHFEARRGSSETPQVTADFDWSLGQLTLRHDGKLESFPLLPGTQDRLSLMYQFMYMRLDKSRIVEFAMTNGRKLDRYRYRVTPDVEIDTALGRLRTLHLVKERDPGDTAAEVWLSPQHHNLPVKVLIIEKDGMRFEQNIQSLELRE